MSLASRTLLLASVFASLFLLIACEKTELKNSETVTVAVASNFLLPMQALSRQYEEQSGIQIKLSAGSSGKLYAQIVNGAPYDFFLSADQEKPMALEEGGWTAPNSRFTYALGRLVLLSSGDEQIGLGSEDQFDTEQIHRSVLEGIDAAGSLAIANPELAPYGAASIEVLRSLDLYESAKGNLVLGENIAQAYQFVHTGNAQLGFVAFSQVKRNGNGVSNRGWVVPEKLHKAIRQDMVLLKKGENVEAAVAFYNWLKMDKARELIQSFGYSLDTVEYDSE